jgi:hypothetical protein
VPIPEEVVLLLAGVLDELLQAAMPRITAAAKPVRTLPFIVL